MKTVESTIKTKLSDDLIALAINKGWTYAGSEDQQNTLCPYSGAEWQWTACFSDFLRERDDLEMMIIEKDGKVKVRHFDYGLNGRLLETDWLDDLEELSYIVSNLYTLWGEPDSWTEQGVYLEEYTCYTWNKK